MVSRYRDIYKHLSRIAETIHAGKAMPSDAEVMAEFKCSRTTARRAYALLHEQGRVRIVPGRGRYVVRAGHVAVGETIADAMARELRRGIASGDLPEGSQLSPPSQLSARHGAHRATGRAAYELCEAGGLVRLEGRRWFVEDGAYARANVAGTGPAGPLAGP